MSTNTPDAGAPGVVEPADAGATDEPTASIDPPSGEVLPPVVLQPPVENPPATECSPGDVSECVVDLLCTGSVTCSAEGTLGPCECQSAIPAEQAIVGARCASDADCLGGATCMRADGNDFVGQGGPAGGYCTFACTNTEDCTARDPQSDCAVIGPNESSFCARTCLSKEPEAGEGKCLNRPDLACLSVVVLGVEPFNAERQLGLCIPQCGSDEECPEGRLCHPQGGVCTDFPAPGNPVGAACAIDTDCQGQACEDRTDGVGTCTASCVLGSLAGCGYGRNPDVREAGCVVPQVSAGGFSEGPGDYGFCLELCDVDADCAQATSAGFVCRPLNPQLSEFFGRVGACGRTNG